MAYSLVSTAQYRFKYLGESNGVDASSGIDSASGIDSESGVDTILYVYTVGPIETNCYVLAQGSECIVIDPGFSGDLIAGAISQYHVKSIIATHGHHDHVGGVADLMSLFDYDIAFLMNKRDADLASMASKVGLGGEKDAPSPSEYLANGDLLSIGNITFKVLETPGHTPGGIVLFNDDLAFCGDTVFRGSVGRTDLPGGSYDELMHSIQLIKDTLHSSCNLLCGHGPSTTMNIELASNPYF